MRALRKILDKLLQNRHNRVIVIANTKDDFVFGIVLAAKAGEFS